VGLRPLVCFAKIWYYTTVSNHQYTPLEGKRQTLQSVQTRLVTKQVERINAVLASGWAIHRRLAGVLNWAAFMEGF